MQKAGILLALVVGLFSSLLGQSTTTTVEWGPEIAKTSVVSPGWPLGTDDISVYGFSTELFGSKKKKDVIQVERYNAQSLVLEKTYDLASDLAAKNLTPVDVIFKNGKLLLISRSLPLKGISAVYLQEINKQTLTFEGVPIKLAEISENDDPYNYWQVLWSADKSKYAVVFISGRFMMVTSDFMSTAKTNYLNAVVLDEQSKLLYYQKINLPPNAQDYDISNYELDNDGNLYYVTRNALRQKGAIQKFTFSFTVTQVNSASVIGHKIELGQNFVKDLVLKISQTGNPVCAGIYHTDADYNNVVGLYVSTLDATGKTTKNVSVPFSEETKKKYETRLGKSNAKGSKDLDNLVIKEIFALPAGGFMVVVEKDFLTSNNGMSINYREDFMILALDNNLGLNWETRVPRSFFFSGNNLRGTSEVVSFMKDNKLNLVYHDHEKNLIGDNVTTQSVSPRISENPVLVLATVSADGKFERRKLYGSKDADVMCYVDRVLVEDKKKLVLYGHNQNNGFKMGVLHVE